MIPGNGCTRLVPTRKKADYLNTSEYAKLTSVEYTYTMKVTTTNPYDSETMKKNLLCSDSISLKIGTKVMCIVNTDELCNGSQGIVIGFEEFPIVRFAEGDILMKPHAWTSEYTTIKQLPLIYAWAITIHKAQGATLQEAELDLGSDIFECGQTYVALSRVVDLSGLYLIGFNAYKIKLHPKVVEFYINIGK
jgi:ATP-dependent DNA helicase PIF1